MFSSTRANSTQHQSENVKRHVCVTAVDDQPDSQLALLSSFIVNTAECRTPVTVQLEDIPHSTSLPELCAMMARIAEVPLLSFELMHTDDRIAGRRIHEAIQRGAWLLFHIPVAFAGVEGLLRDLGRRLFTITPNDHTRPLMGRFRLLIAMPKDTPKSTVFKKLALPLPIHKQMIIHPTDVNTYVRLADVQKDVTECVVGAMFYRATEINGSNAIVFEPESRTRPFTAFPASHRAQRERAEKARPASALTVGNVTIPSSAAPRNVGRVNAVADVLTLHQSTTDPYERERAEAERELFEKHASDVSQKVFGFLMRRYFNVGDVKAREAFKPFNTLVDIGGEHHQHTRGGGGGGGGGKGGERDAQGEDMFAEVSLIISAAHASLAARQSNLSNSATRSSSPTTISTVALPQESAPSSPQRRYPTVTDGETDGLIMVESAPPSSRSGEGGAAGNEYGFSFGDWRSVAVWALPLFPVVGEWMPPLPSFKEALCTVQHPSLLSPIGKQRGMLLYPRVTSPPSLSTHATSSSSAASWLTPLPASTVVKEVRHAIKAIGVLCNALLALRDCGFAHRNVCLASLIVLQRTLQDGGAGGGRSRSPNGARQYDLSSNGTFRLLVTNQAAPYALNSDGLLVADCGVCSRVYMSPEAIRTGEWTYADDAWAVGVILWQLLSACCGGNADPFADLQNEKQVAALVASDSFDPSDRFPIPRNASPQSILLWEAVGRQCLMPDPRKRITLTQIIAKLPA